VGRERITISVQDSLVRQIDRLIDKQNIRNRSHAIESILADSLQSNEINAGVLFVGGQQARESIAELRRLADQLVEQEIDRIVVVLGEYGRELKRTLFPQEQSFLIEYHSTKQGSGGGLRELRNRLPDQFVFVNTTEFAEPEVSRLVQYHRRYNPLVTLQPVPLGTYFGIGVMKSKAIDLIPSGFSILEEDIFPKLVERHELILLPPQR